MDTRHLRAFVTVAEKGNFTRAAIDLAFAQSTVTAQVQSLEREIGVDLFDRLPNNVRLSSAGERFLPYARRILGLTSEARQVSNPSAELSGTLVIGAMESITSYRLLPVFEFMHLRHPGVRLSMRPSLSPGDRGRDPLGQLRRRVRGGRPDLHSRAGQPGALRGATGVGRQPDSQAGRRERPGPVATAAVPGGEHRARLRLPGLLRAAAEMPGTDRSRCWNWAASTPSGAASAREWASRCCPGSPSPPTWRAATWLPGLAAALHRLHPAGVATRATPVAVAGRRARHRPAG